MAVLGHRDDHLLLLLRHLGHLLQEDLLQGLGHQHNVVCGLEGGEGGAAVHTGVWDLPLNHLQAPCTAPPHAREPVARLFLPSPATPQPPASASRSPPPPSQPALAQAHLVVDVAVGEHGVEVLHALGRAPVVAVLQPPLDGPHVHRLLDDLVVVLGGRGEQQGVRRRGSHRLCPAPPTCQSRVWQQQQQQHGSCPSLEPITHCPPMPKARFCPGAPASMPPGGRPGNATLPSLGRPGFLPFLSWGAT